MTTEIPLGTRVVLRYSLPPGSSHAVTDVIGILEGADPVGVRSTDGHLTEVSPDRVVALKALNPRPIRTSEIRALEHAAARGWPGVEQEWIDGWLLRFGHGFTGRANAAVPLEESASLDSLDAITEWYSARGRQTILLLPDRLGSVPQYWQSWNEVQVLAADIDNLTLPSGPSMVVVHSEPTPLWLSGYHYRGHPVPPPAAEVLSAVHGQVGFGYLGSPVDPPIAVTRAAVTEAPDGNRWVGLTAVEVAAMHRGHGVGPLICAEMIRWGHDRGATHTYVQVAAENVGALSMYRRMGFVDHHRYRYAASPHVRG